MDLTAAAQAWRTDGFVILPGFLPAEELTSALGELDLLFPSADGFHDGTDPRHERFIGDEFAGIDTFPFASAEISLAAVNHRILALAEALLGDDDLHLYGAEAWAKYTGACDYDQALHRDYLNHTVLVPSTTPGCQQVEMFVFLNDVPEELGPPHLVSRKHTAHLPAVPNWLLPPGQEGTDRFVAEADPQLYEAEVSGAGPAGTVIAFEPGTYHRGTQLSAPRGRSTACICASGRPACSGDSGSVGRRRASRASGSSSSAAPPRGNCRSSVSPGPDTLTGRLRPWQAWHCAIRGATFRPGDRRVRKRSADMGTRGPGGLGSHGRRNT
ncbi:phytanoyl-CoA dioxygenase family protein [Actinoplanes oblitus]|uniref:Phytanoyl-CoA dioxygenase family protein n=1 Tax=Actinoplanes oblitus TaxID=3040509 RepID=A0ABY8WTI0_9ACTN|nr:phytanoyl-CoA dioxygenase family protein [Actinoplanes oblitus]WIN00307.1 phytanoyl-CoA dioxygenase family protein [Actinoplanes oblitus]